MTKPALKRHMDKFESAGTCPRSRVKQTTEAVIAEDRDETPDQEMAVAGGLAGGRATRKRKQTVQANAASEADLERGLNARYTQSQRRK